MTAQFGKIKSKVLFVLSRTDKLFPPDIAPGVMQGLKSAGVDADYFLLDSEYGHSASGLDAHKWAPRLKQFMEACSPDAAKRNPGLLAANLILPDYASLHPGYEDLKSPPSSRI